MAAQEIVLEVRNISKSLGGKDILKDCSLNVARGELKVLIGPSGAGKSTLLQCINCLIPPDKGEIILEGEPLNRADKKSLCSFRARVGMIFQDFNLFDHLTAQDNVAIALRKVRGMSKKEASERAMDELARVGLALCKGPCQRNPLHAKRCHHRTGYTGRSSGRGGCDAHQGLFHQTDL